MLSDGFLIITFQSEKSTIAVYRLKSFELIYGRIIIDYFVTILSIEYGLRLKNAATIEMMEKSGIEVNKTKYFRLRSIETDQRF